MTIAERLLAHRRQAAQALRAKRWLDAETELRAYLQLAPDDPIAWNNLGVVLENEHRNREAVAAYAQAAALMPQAVLPRRNLVREMQRYLGFPAALGIYRVVDIGIQLLPLPDPIRTWLRVAALALLFLGALAFYIRRRDELPTDAWHTYTSEMARTRKLRYGGIAFVFAGFLLFAVVLFLLTLVPGGAGDGTIVLVIVAGLCWLAIAQLLWRRVVRRLLERHIS